MNFVFRTSFQDVVSGFRVMNRNFLRSVPLINRGFETETELTLLAILTFFFAGEHRRRLALR